MRSVLVACSVLAASCGGTSGGESVETMFVQAESLVFGANDNPEAVKVIPGTSQVLLLSSKSRELTLISVDDGSLEEVRSASLLPNDPSESELTQLAVHPEGEYAILTRTLVDQEGETVTGCRGSIVLVSISDRAEFGTVHSEIDVGPMPDAIDISPDGHYAVVGNERDVVYGKCEGVEDVDPASLSVIDLSGGAAAAMEVARVEMTENEEREPESITFLDDGTFAVSLQDSHEIAITSVAAILEETVRSDADLDPITLPRNATGQDAWPDGVIAFHDGDDEIRIATAGEANDMITIVDGTGELVGEIAITSTDVPADFPRDGSWGPLFRPDSLASFEWQGRVLLAASLKASGAIGIWDVTDASASEVVAMVKVGDHEASDESAESSVGTEGIAASTAGGFIVAANEVESSLSLVLAPQ